MTETRKDSNRSRADRFWGSLDGTPGELLAPSSAPRPPPTPERQLPRAGRTRSHGSERASRRDRRRQRVHPGRLARPPTRCSSPGGRNERPATRPPRHVVHQGIVACRPPLLRVNRRALRAAHRADPRHAARRLPWPALRAGALSAVPLRPIQGDPHGSHPHRDGHLLPTGKRIAIPAIYALVAPLGQPSRDTRAH